MNVQRTVILPVASDGSWALAWPGKYQPDTLPYQIDCTDWLADGGFTVASVGVSASSSLVVGQLAIGLASSNSPKLISMVIGGGAAGMTEQLGITLTLVGGYLKYVLVSLPILQDATGLVAVTPASSSGSTGSSTTAGTATSTGGPDPSTLLTTVL